MTEFIEIKEASEIIGVHAETLRKLIRKGKIEAVKFGNKYKIKKIEIDRILKEGF